MINHRPVEANLGLTRRILRKRQAAMGLHRSKAQATGSEGGTKKLVNVNVGG